MNANECNSRSNILNNEFAQARAEEQRRDDQRKQELEVLQSSVTKTRRGNSIRSSKKNERKRH